MSGRSGQRRGRPGYDGRMVLRLLRVWVVAFLLLVVPATAFAQRELHWDLLSVTAHLNADGSLQVTEEQTMVFSGDWNGGERTFNIRPRQRLTFDGMSRMVGTSWQPMTDGGLSLVDNYSFTNRETLRWRSRETSDPPFNNTAIRYQLRYTLSGILQVNGEQYTLDHDFAFPDRVGDIKRFELRLTVDPAWEAITPIKDQYTATDLSPGNKFVLTIPLKYVGAGTPVIYDDSRPPAIRAAILALIAVPLVSIVWVLLSEGLKGRFAPLPGDVDEAWLREHILKHPAELVSAAWDDSIGQPEVVALLARMASEKKIESSVSDRGLTMRMTIARSKLAGYEKNLIDKLFYGERTTTSTEDVKSHYKKTGFNPVSVIEKDLASALKATFPFAEAPKGYGIETAVLLLGGLALAIYDWIAADLPGLAVFLLFLGSLLVAGLASIPGGMFRKRLHWGLGEALLCLLFPAAFAGGVGAFLWYYVGAGYLYLSTLTITVVVALALGATVAAINALRSRQRREGIAFRKELAAGRLYFMSQLRTQNPALHDDWYPWLLAFELEKQMDAWSVTHGSTGISHSSRSDYSSSSGSSSSSSSSSSWTGFGSGRSGGAGATAGWAAAASGMAAGVSAPSSSSSSGGGSSGGGGGGSSGGGGGGGW